MSDAFKVTSAAAVAYRPDGSHALFYRNDVLPEGLRDGERERLVEEGFAEKSDAAAHIDPGSKDDPGAGGGGKSSAKSS